jgi:cell division septum initiation protein DivIVA
MTDAQLAQLALMVADLRGAYEQVQRHNEDVQQRNAELERLVEALQEEREALQAQLVERVMSTPPLLQDAALVGVPEHDGADALG